MNPLPPYTPHPPPQKKKKRKEKKNLDISEYFRKNFQSPKNQNCLYFSKKSLE